MLTGSSTAQSFTNAPNDWSDNNVSIEVWFKPDNLTPTPANGQVIFEDGGGTGLGLFLDNNEIRARKMPGSGNVAYNVSTDPSALLLAPATSEYIQAVVTYDISTGSLQLFINGSLIGTEVPSGGDWSGSDPFALGTLGGANTGGIGGGQSETESFDGQISLFRVYNDQVLNSSEVLSNFFNGQPFNAKTHPYNLNDWDHNVTISGTPGTVEFSKTLTGLAVSTTYHARVRAVNSASAC